MTAPKPPRGLAAAVAASVLLPGMALAQNTELFNDRFAFDQALADRALLIERESFESGSASSGLRVITTASGLIVSDDPIESPDADLGISFTSSVGAFPTEGFGYLLYNDNDADGNRITFTFPRPTNLFGVDITDAADNNSAVDIIAATNTGQAFLAVPGGQSNGNQQFFGLISDTPFTTVTFDLTDVSLDGEVIGFDNIVFSLVNVFANLGRVANQNHPLYINTDGSTLDTIAAIYDQNGDVIFENDDDVTRDAAFNGVSLPGPGRYYLALADCCTGFDDMFGAINIGNDTGIVTTDLAGDVLDAYQQQPSEIRYFAFDAAGDVDTLTPTGPIPTVDAGVVAAPFQDFEVSFFFTGDTGFIDYAIYDRATGRVVSFPVLTGTNVVNGLPKGDYIIAIAADNDGQPFRDGYRLQRSQSFANNLVGTIAPISTIKGIVPQGTFGPVRIEPNEMRFIAITIDSSNICDIADLDGDGDNDLLDAFLFLDNYNPAACPPLPPAP